MESWDGSILSKTMLTCVNQCISYAAYAGNPYSPGQILAKVFHMVFQTGLFHTACQEWKRLPLAQKTYNHFKQQILLAQQDNRNEQCTSKEAGYRLAVQAEKMENKDRDLRQCRHHQTVKPRLGPCGSTRRQDRLGGWQQDRSTEHHQPISTVGQEV
jgi:hypothetical protein